MTWRILGKPISTAEINTAQVYQTFKVPSVSNMLIRGINVGLIIYNNPSFTSVSLNIFDDDSGVPGKLIASSNAFTKALIHTLPHAFKVVGFTFADIIVKAGSYYHLALGGVAYTGDATSHIAWRNSYPDPQFTTGVILDAAHADNHPFETCIIGTEI